MKVTEDYVSFETAKLLKEKGFEGQCSVEQVCTEISHNEDSEWTTEREVTVGIPTLQMAMKWLRKEYNFHIDPYPENNNTWCLIIWELYPKQVKQCNGKYDNRSYSTYEEACEAAIKYCLENLI